MEFARVPYARVDPGGPAPSSSAPRARRSTPARPPPEPGAPSPRSRARGRPRARRAAVLGAARARDSAPARARSAARARPPREPPAAQVIGDDYTTKFLLKAKVAPKAIPLSFTIENEVKDSVDGKLTAKYVEPTTGVSFDKLTLKGKTYGVEASKTVSGIKFKGKVNPADASSAALTAELKSDKNTVIASVDKKKLAGSGTLAPFKVGVFGGGFEYPVSGGALSFSLGGSATVSGVFASCVYTPKKVFNFGMMFSPMPKLTVAATGDSTGADSATVGLKHSGLGAFTLGLKTSAKALSAVIVKKVGKDATAVFGATAKYADMKPAFGFQLTIG